MIRSLTVAVLGTIALAVTGCNALRSDGSKTSDSIDSTLDSLHANASAANEPAYFALFAPEAVFIGTDPSEIWTLEAFRAYAHDRFKTGTGWTYTVRSRHVHIDDSGAFAFFEETLDNAKYGECRGTGVLRNVNGTWKIAQYSLSLPIPNDLFPAVAQQIKDYARSH